MTPCAGTSSAMNVLTTVPLSVCVHKSCTGAEGHVKFSRRSQEFEKRAYPYGVLTTCANEWRFGQIERHGGGFV